MDIGNRIRQLRLQHDLSQEALASALAVSRQAVTKWENNTSKPSTANLLALCALFDLSLDEFLAVDGGQMGAVPEGKFGWISKIPLKGMALAGIALLIAAVLGMIWEKRKISKINGYIGYADAPTGIFVTGVSPLWVALGWVAGVLLVGSILLFWIGRHKRKTK